MPDKRNSYINCSECLENQRILNNNDYKAYLEKRKINTTNMPIEQFAEISGDFQAWLTSMNEKVSKCPFKLKFPENLPIKQYKLKCMKCGTKFGCPAEVYRDGKIALCGDCEADKHYDYPEINDKDEMRELY